MLASREIMERFPVRKSQSQKEAFFAWLTDRLQGMGYEPRGEQGRNLVRCRNIIAGDPDKAEILLTAHYDTCATLPVPNFITPRNPVVFLAYQLLLVAVILGMGTLAELLVLFLWKDAPMWAAIGAMDAVVLFCLWWMLAGKANKTNVNDNTSGVMLLYELAAALPEEERDRVCLVWFDNEEKGLLGSGLFAKKHPHARKEALVLNFDCVSDGDFLHLFPGKKVRADGVTMEALRQAFRGAGKKTAEVVEGYGVYPSDQKNFARGVGICALRKHKWIGYYMNRIHTHRDTIMEEENLEILREDVLTYLKNTHSAPTAVQ